MSAHLTTVPGTPRETERSDLKELLRKSVVLSSLESLLKYDDDKALKTQVCRRYCELTGGLDDPI